MFVTLKPANVCVKPAMRDHIVKNAQIPIMDFQIVKSATVTRLVQFRLYVTQKQVNACVKIHSEIELAINAMLAIINIQSVCLVNAIARAR